LPLLGNGRRIVGQLANQGNGEIMEKTDYVLKNKPEPAANETGWAFDLGARPDDLKFQIENCRPERIEFEI
jgi:hypothetical protein